MKKGQMKTESDYGMDIQLGNEAQRIMEDKTIKGAIDDMRGACYHNIETSHFSQVDEREDLYKMLQAIRSFERQLGKKIDTAKIAASVLEKVTKIKQI